MIEKILKNVKWHQLKKVIPDDQIVIDQMITKTINELVDAVNGILAMQEQYATIYNEDIVPMLTPENKEPAENSQSSKIEQDKFAEQHNYDVYVKNRHLIGKLCKFKSGAGYTYGILTNIKRKPSQWAFESNGRAFSSCEPVKPTDSIIYKGGNYERI